MNQQRSIASHWCGRQQSWIRPYVDINADIVSIVHNSTPHASEEFYGFMVVVLSYSYAYRSQRKASCVAY